MFSFYAYSFIALQIIHKAKGNFPHPKQAYRASSVHRTPSFLLQTHKWRHGTNWQMLVKDITEEPCLVRNFSQKKNKNLSARLQYRQCFIVRLMESTNFWFFIAQLTFSFTLSTPRLHPSYLLYFLSRYTALNPKTPTRNNSNLLLDLGGLLNVIVKRRRGRCFLTTC